MSIPWGQVQLDDSDDGLEIGLDIEIETDVHDEESSETDDNDYSTPTIPIPTLSLSTTSPTRLTNCCAFCLRNSQRRRQFGRIGQRTSVCIR